VKHETIDVREQIILTFHVCRFTKDAMCTAVKVCDATDDATKIKRPAT